MKKGGMQIYGIQPVAGVLEQYPDIVESMYVSDTRRDAKVDYLISHKKSRRISVVGVSIFPQTTAQIGQQRVRRAIMSSPLR